jgi:non-specific serine/threonine protein kinase/serine/threonine-protein kinase
VSSEDRSTSPAPEGLESAPTLALHDTARRHPDHGRQRLGSYRLVTTLGRGGMGTVYRAVREEDGKQVAIKVLHGIDAHELSALLDAERRILAGLEHDNIARLIDGGTTEDGLPYFTMEHVEGVPIGDYCAARGLDVSARLQLVRRVCAAVEYAHQRLVIHRDLKPGNILVTSEGVPKLVDFGIAKLLTAEDTGKAALTRELAMTPEFASPEQVRGEAVTTATDIYGLGLLLYELLTGHRAQRLRMGTPEEIVRVVCKEEPPRPSAVAPPALRRRLAGDLDAIVLKALRKEPGRRYASVGELAEDLRRHLELLPVRARGDDRSYRAGRFVRRHRAALAAGALVAVSLVGGTAVALYQARRAERRFEDVRRLAGSFLFEVHDAIQDLPGATPARRLLVKKALEYLDRLASEAGGDTDLLAELAVAYMRVGDVQGYPSNPNLGDGAGAAASYKRARELAERLVAAEPDDPGFRLTLARVLERQGTVQASLGDGAAARTTLNRARELLEELHRIRPQDRAVTHNLHVVHLRFGDLLQAHADVDEAARQFEAGRRLAEQVLATAPADAEARRDLGVALSRLANLWGARDPARGLALQQRLLALAVEDLARQPDSARLRRDLSVGYEDTAQMYAALGNVSAALQHQGRALAIREELSRTDPENEQALQDVSVSHAQIGDVLMSTRRYREALESYRRSLAIDTRIAAHNPENQRAQDFLGSSLINVAEALAHLGAVPEALDHYRRGLEILGRLSDADPANTGLRTYVAQVWVRYGEVQGTHRREACAAFARSADLWSDLAARGAVGKDEAPLQAEAQKRLAQCPPPPRIAKTAPAR